MKLTKQTARLLSEDPDAEPVAVTKTRTAHVFTCCNFLTTAMAIVCIVLLLILYLRPQSAPLPVPCPEAVLTADNVTCGQTTDCQQGFADATNTTCDIYNRPSNTTCRLTCADEGEEGMCNGRGECVGNVSQCPGTCEDRFDCHNENTFFNDDVLSYSDSVTGWTYSSWYQQRECYFNKCMWTILDVYVTSSKFAIWKGGDLVEGWWPGASRFQCSDYISPTLLASQPGCFYTDRYLLSPHLIAYDEYGNGVYGNETFPFQVSFCVLSYKCSRADPTEELIAAGNGHTVRPMRSPEQRGFSLIASSNTVPLGIADPLLRNQMYDKLEEMINVSLPIFLDRLFENVTFVPVPSPAES